MSNKPKILAFAGSLRRDSYNKKLIKVAVAGAEKAGADVTLIELNEFPMPLYCQDIEDQEGLPSTVLKFKELMLSHDGLMIASPEYNSSIPGVLKNTLDWASRKASKDERDLSCFIDKVAVIMSASPGALGGLRMLVHLRAMLENIKVIVLPDQKTIPAAMNAFEADGSLKDPAQQRAVERLGQLLKETLVKLKT